MLENQTTTSDTLDISAQNYKYLTDFIKELSGLHLEEGKEYLIKSRLKPIVEKYGYRNFDDMVAIIRDDPRSPLVTEILEAMSTYESFFFRDKHPFDQFENVILPKILAEKTNKDLRIWCAASSSGQEPYSLSIILNEKEAELEGWNKEITATDISAHIVEKAKKGEYTQFEVQRGLPIQYLMKYFAQDDTTWTVKENLKNLIQFSQLNLLKEYWNLGSFDVIYCRNVLIYFDVETKKKVLEHMARKTNPGGYLFLGGSETLVGVTDCFKPVEGQRGMYQLV